MKAHSGEYFGIYAGKVVDASDPAKVGRVKVRVPILHGLASSSSGLVEDKDLPWAFPAAMPAGGTPESGGMSWLPVQGDQIWVKFLDGELDKPIWEWGNQNIPQLNNFGSLPVHKYQSDGAPSRRSAFTRYSHWWELLPTGHDIWTKSGYHATIVDEQTSNTPSGKLLWSTALGYLLELNDSNKTLSAFAENIEQTCKTESISATDSFEVSTPLFGLNFGKIELGGNYNDFFIDGVTRSVRGLRVALNQLGLEVSGPILIQCSGFSITTGGLSFDSSNNPSTSGNVGLSVQGDQIGVGVNASDPVVRLSDLVKALTSVKQIFDIHVHSAEGLGPPTVPAIYQASGSQKVVAETTSATLQIVGGAG
jgi:hypothetical protein